MAYRRAAGFSLIELVIVIAVMAILGALLIPGLGKINQKARAVAIENIAHSLQTAIESYQLETGGYPTNEMTGYDLMKLLASSGVIGSIPKNPYTNRPIAANDQAGRMAYHWDSTNQMYQLTVYGQNDQDVIVVLGNG